MVAGARSFSWNSSRRRKAKRETTTPPPPRGGEGMSTTQGRAWRRATSFWCKAAMLLRTCRRSACACKTHRAKKALTFLLLTFLDLMSGVSYLLDLVDLPCGGSLIRSSHYHNAIMHSSKFADDPSPRATGIEGNGMRSTIASTSVQSNSSIHHGSPTSFSQSQPAYSTKKHS